MGKKREERRAKSEEDKEKPIFGSGAEMQPEPKDDRLVKCVCTVACAWKGYHDEGDRVMVEREMLENDPFFKGHFKLLEAQPGGQRSQDGDGAGSVEGTQSQATDHDGNADGGTENADDGQGELELK